MPEENEKGQALYRGLQGYKKFDPGRSNKTSKPSKFLGIGPQRAPDNVKITCRFDYQPDICKDWKETFVVLILFFTCFSLFVVLIFSILFLFCLCKDSGYCGYGQSCKFLHDRTDYKSGWQIEKEWNEKQKLRNEELNKHGKILGKREENWEIHSSEEDSDIDNDGLPFACYICRDGFTNPVVTQCKHYFCEDCAFKRFKKTQSCAVCGSDTNGQFQTADKLIEKLKRKKC